MPVAVAMVMAIGVVGIMLVMRMAIADARGCFATEASGAVFVLVVGVIAVDNVGRHELVQ